MVYFSWFYKTKKNSRKSNFLYSLDLNIFKYFTARWMALSSLNGFFTFWQTSMSLIVKSIVLKVKLRFIQVEIGFKTKNIDWLRFLFAKIIKNSLFFVWFIWNHRFTMAKRVLVSDYTLFWKWNITSNDRRMFIVALNNFRMLEIHIKSSRITFSISMWQDIYQKRIKSSILSGWIDRNQFIIYQRPENMHVIQRLE